MGVEVEMVTGGQRWFVLVACNAALLTAAFWPATPQLYALLALAIFDLAFVVSDRVFRLRVGVRGADLDVKAAHEVKRQLDQLGVAADIDRLKAEFAGARSPEETVAITAKLMWPLILDSLASARQLPASRRSELLKTDSVGPAAKLLFSEK